MTAFSLKLIAMLAMLTDHVGMVLFPDQIWLRCVGRLAFPIFAFQIAEGYQKTHDKTKYALRLFLFALLSEIPFDLMISGQPFFWGKQNVLWTFLLGLFIIHITSEIHAHMREPIVRLTAIFCAALLSFSAAQLLHSDYGGLGVLMVFLFYVLRNRDRGIQTLFILTVNYLIGGAGISIWGAEFPMQLLGTAAMLPICLYKGEHGPHGKVWTWFCYAFYPLHLIILFSLR